MDLDEGETMPAAKSKPKITTNLKAIRDASGLKQKEAAERMGVNPSTYNSWETGARRFNIEDMLRICAFFGCTPNDLFGFSNVTSFLPANPDEATLLDSFRGMGAHYKQTLIDVAQGLEEASHPRRRQTEVIATIDLEGNVLPPGTTA